MAKFKKDSEYPRFNSFSELRAYALKEQERLGKSDSWYFELSVLVFLVFVIIVLFVIIFKLIRNL